MAPNPNITTEQLLPENYRLLQARQQLWDDAVWWQVAQFLLVVVAPLGGALLAAFDPALRPLVGAIAVGLSLADVSYFDRRYRAAIKLAARASEQFDVALFHLPWNKLSAGNPLSPEETDSAVRKWVRKHPKEEVKAWYSTSVSKVPLHLARVICQRTNVAYDSALRRNYATVLLTVALVISGGIFAAGFARSTELDDLVMSALVPVSPLLIWALREFFRQKDAAAANDAIRAEADMVLEQVISGSCDEPTCTSHSVRLQAALFVRRSTNVLIFPGLYRWRRENLEKDMNAGADHWVSRAVGVDSR
jgi:hypothetical protein